MRFHQNNKYLNKKNIFLKIQEINLFRWITCWFLVSRRRNDFSVWASRYLFGRNGSITNGRSLAGRPNLLSLLYVYISYAAWIMNTGNGLVAELHNNYTHGYILNVLYDAVRISGLYTYASPTGWYPPFATLY